MAGQGRAKARPTLADPSGTPTEHRPVSAPIGAGVGHVMPERAEESLDTWAVQSDAHDHRDDDPPVFDVTWTDRHTRP